MTKLSNCAVILIAVTGCAGGPGKSLVPTEVAFGLVDVGVALSDRGVTLSHDLREGGLALFRTALPGEENAVISPFAVQAALGMMYLAAEHPADRDDIALALRWTQPPEQFSVAFRELTTVIATDLASSPTVELQTATRLWSSTRYRLRPDYQRAVEETFLASVVPLDFKHQPHSALATINQWAAQQTGGRIPALLPADAFGPDEEVNVVQTAALRVKARWRDLFFDLGERLAFRTLQGQDAQVPAFMGRTRASHARTAAYEAVDIAYEGETLSLLVIVPEDFRAFVSALNATALEDVQAGLAARSIDLILPSFDTSSAPDVTTALDVLGMKRTLSDVTTLALYEEMFTKIDRVHHQASISVDAAGTEAVAAAAVEGDVPMSSPPLVRVDRPFVYILHDRATNTPLFVGRVTDPR
jgi:serpin B